MRPSTHQCEYCKVSAELMRQAYRVFPLIMHIPSAIDFLAFKEEICHCLKRAEILLSYLTGILKDKMVYSF